MMITSKMLGRLYVRLYRIEVKDDSGVDDASHSLFVKRNVT